MDDHSNRKPDGRLTIGEAQSLVHESIIGLGGYWRPLSAVARVLEELGELAELLPSSSSTNSRLSSELADIFIISTCLGNQYCADLTKEYHRLGLSLDSPDSAADHAVDMPPFQRLVSSAATLARVINAYEGDKCPKPDEQLPTVQSAVASMHADLLRCARHYDVHLGDVVAGQLARVVERDRGRFRNSYDPCASESLVPFNVVKNSTQCIFARIAKVWGAPSWETGSSPRGLEDHLRMVVPVFERFLRIARFEGLDGFVVTLPGQKFGGTLDRLAETTRRVLRFLSNNDPAGARSMDQDMDSPTWEFSFAGERCFVLTFAPCYDHRSSRYAFGENATIIFIQPQFSFDNVHVSRGMDEATASATIRREFETAGRPYVSELIATPLEAPRYVKPLSLADMPLRWWEQKVDLTANTDMLAGVHNVVHVGERLKMELRHSWLSDGRRESVAEHTWRTLLMALLLAPHLQHKVNLERTLAMIVIHDLAEAQLGDIVEFQKLLVPEQVHARERDAMHRITSVLGADARRIVDLWLEFEKAETLEARCALALDKLEAQVQHNEANIDTWQPEEKARVFSGRLEEYASHDTTLLAFATIIVAEAAEKIGGESRSA